MENKAALLVIDMQTVAFDGVMTPPITNGPGLLARVSKLIDICRRKGVEVIYIQTSAVSGRPYAKDVHGWEIHPLLTPHNHDTVVSKTNSSGFDGTDLVEVLDGLGIKSIITCGIWSEFCVTNTSLDASRLGYDVCLIADAHGTVADSDGASTELIAQQNAFLRRQQVSVLTITDFE